MAGKTLISAQRLIFIDVFRGLATLWMIETHAVNEFLFSAFKDNSAFSLLNISNGFVSVAFIFCAGAGFWLALERKHEDYRRFGSGFRSYMQRLLFILLLAFLLQTPKFSLSRTLDSSHEEILRLLSCNVLHLIVYCSLASLLLSISTNKLRAIKIICVLISILTVFITPFMRSFDPFAIMPIFPATLFAGSPVSLFPLFPWSCYFFAGVASAAFFRSAQNKTRFSIALSIISTIIIILIFYIKDALHVYSFKDQWWSIAPEHTIFRIAGALLLFSILFLLEEKLKGKFGNLLTAAGQESLYIYVLQGIIIYSAVGRYHLYDFLGNNLTPWSVSALIIAITSFCLSTAVFWRRMKKIYPETSKKYARISFVLVLILYIVFPAKF